MADTTGAAAVADAVKKVADAAVAAIAKEEAPLEGDFYVFGSAGARFEIRPKAGVKLGTNGRVTFGGRDAKIEGWGATHIVGLIPSGAGAGEVVVHIDDQTQKRGYFRG